MPIVISARIATESAPPVEPNRNAAQISAGNTTYVSGFESPTASVASVTTERIRSKPSIVQIRRSAYRGSRAHVRASGRTTIAPAVSPSHQVRQNDPISVVSITPPSRIEIVPTVALTAVAIPSANSIPT